MMLVWWGVSLLGASLAAGFGCYMWGSHVSNDTLDTEYEEGYNDGMRAARAEMDHADQIILRTQELDVPRPGQPKLVEAAYSDPPPFSGPGHTSRLPVHAAEKSGSHEAYAQEPGHTIYAELTPEALDDTPPPEPDAGFQDVTPADFLSLLSDDEFWPASRLYFAAARCLADAPWQPLPAWTPRMLERAA